nr:reverse transcriptase [Tanacetum cinerariifolium]
MTTRTKAIVRWTKPNGDNIKFNCDASWQKESGKAGLGFAARNACGDVLLLGARTEWYASSPLEAEAKPLLWATHQAHNKGYFKIIFESNSLCLVNALQRDAVVACCGFVVFSVMAAFFRLQKVYCRNRVVL